VSGLVQPPADLTQESMICCSAIGR
jgi:hypothetical protein